jgi:hypothetical protein
MHLSTLAAASFVSLAVLPLPPATPAGPVNQVRWLAGCWRRETPRLVIEEHWMPPRGGTMLGMGRTVRDDTLREYEVVLLREHGPQLAYEAHPGDQAPATFLSELVTDSMVVFGNPAHDFPQRIGYRRVGTDSLAAWIEGSVGGRSRRVDFPYRRTSCDGD